MPLTRWTSKPPLGTRINGAHQLARGLEACWLFNEGQGNIALDLTGNQHHFLLGQGPGDSSLTAWTLGQFTGPCLRSLATTNTTTGNLSPRAISTTNAMTFEWWMQTLGSDTYAALATLNATIGFFLRSNNFLDIYTAGDHLTVTPLITGTWYHVVAVMQRAPGNLVTFYLNGRKDITVDAGATLGNFTSINSVLNDSSSETFVGLMDVMRVWTRDLDADEVRQLYREPFGMCQQRRRFFTATAAPDPVTVLTVTPAQMQWQAPAPPLRTAIQVTPARLQWRAATPAIPRTLIVTPARIQWRAATPTISRVLHIPPARMQWQAQTPAISVGYALRDCGSAYDLALAQPFIAGDWLIQASAIGLKQSFHYTPDTTWQHRIMDISDIEVNAPPGGGMATVGNVTIRLAEASTSASVLQQWEQAVSCGDTQLTIDFLLDGQLTGLRMFSGRIDTLTLRDAVTEILVVDDSIQRNIQLPQTLIDVATFPNADLRALTQPEPLVYGDGTTIGAAPMLLVNVPSNTYLVTEHAITFGGAAIAAYEPGTNTFVTKTNVLTASGIGPGDGSQLQGMVNFQELRLNSLTPTMQILTQLNVTDATAAIDGSSTTVATISTGSINSNLDGYGELIVGTTATSALRANNTLVVTMQRHRRSLTSLPTVTGTFSIQTYDQATATLLRDNLFVTEAFRQTLNPLTTSFTAPAINVGATTTIAVRLLARNEGGAGLTTDTYEVGDISIESYFQPKGDGSEVFVYGTGYTGRYDPDGTIVSYAGLGSGTLLHQPDEVIASIVQQEMGLRIDTAAFAAAYTFYHIPPLVPSFIFDGGIGAGWAVQRDQARTILDALARQGMAILAPTFSGTWGLRPYRRTNPVQQHFHVGNILVSDGAEHQRPEQRTSTFTMTLDSGQQVHSRFEVHYAYNTGSKKYDGVWTVDHTGSNVPASTTDKGLMEFLCLESYRRFGMLDPLVMEAYWIADGSSAAVLLSHLVRYFARQRLTIQFETTLQAACIQVGDFVTVSYPSLPDADDGQLFEVHTIRYMPMKGRVQLTASRSTSLTTILQVTPARLQWQAATGIATLV